MSIPELAPESARTPTSSEHEQSPHEWATPDERAASEQTGSHARGGSTEPQTPRERDTSAAGGSTIDSSAHGIGLIERVQHALAAYLRSRRAEGTELDKDFAQAVDGLIEFVLRGGKRIRPTFAWWGWRAAGGAEHGEQAEAMLRAASALELIQACALVHDDLIDNSGTRRGNPSMHQEFAEIHQRAQWSGSAHQFGMAVAILLGDLSLSWADDMLHTAGLTPESLSRALRPWQAMRTEVLAGQYVDVLGQVREDEDAGAAMRTGQLKAASYTVQRPIELGAAVAGAGPELLAALRRFGRDIGMAFQLRDDLLGVFGDPEVTGKPAGDDLREGKRTLLIAKGLENARGAGDQWALNRIRASLGAADLDEATVREVRTSLIELGAVDAVEQHIAELTESALTALRSVELAEPAASRLAELAVEVTDRNR